MLSCYQLLLLMILTSTPTAIIENNCQKNDNPVSKNAISEIEPEIGFSQKITMSDDSPIFSTTSKYQRISVHKSLYYGKVLVLDDFVQITEKDGDSYNEMMTHIPMMEHRQPKNVLVIGGGDGYVLNEVLKHESVQHVDHVELDIDVIETCKKYFSWGNAWKDERVKLHIMDGATFVKQSPDAFYDVIIQDSSDPTGFDEDGETIDLPSSVLYSKEHFADIARILTRDGIFNFQAETWNIPSDLKGACEWRYQALQSGFESAKYGSLAISSYIGGQIGIMMCKKIDSEGSSMEEIQKRFENIVSQGKTTSYYHPRLQTSSFDLPLWVEKILYNSSDTCDDIDVPDIPDSWTTFMQ